MRKLLRGLLLLTAVGTITFSLSFPVCAMEPGWQNHYYGGSCNGCAYCDGSMSGQNQARN